MAGGDVKKILWLTVALFLCTPVSAQWQLDLEAGAFKPAYNRVQIPNDNQGDRFNINDLGNGSFSAGRLSLGWQPAENHRLQLVYAPFVYSERGSFDEDVRFDGASFSASDPVRARYQFTSYRLRYLYRWQESGPWVLDIGGTAFVRDASIRLRAPGVESEDSNVGFVPLLALRTAYDLNDRWSAMLDSDLAFAPQGRAVDLALLARYRLDDRISLSGGYRTIEGGADNDDVYSFAWFNGVVLKASFAW
jgi:hypothetical protein